jgi:hypothetical protein
MKIVSILVQFVAAILAFVWTYSVLVLANVSIGIGGSGMSENVIETMEYGFYAFAVLSGVLVAAPVRNRWLVLAVALQFAFARFVAGKPPDGYTVYFAAINYAGLLGLSQVVQRFR